MKTRSMAAPVVAAVAILLLGSSLAWARNISEGLLSTSDHHFMLAAARGNLTEIMMGRLAVVRGNSQQVRDLGNTMIVDHTKASRDLSRVAMTLHVDLPTNPNESQMSMINRLSRLRGEAFDRAWLQAMHRDHVKDSKAFSREAQSGQEASVRAFAARTLPVINQHEQMIAVALQAHTQATGTH